MWWPVLHCAEQLHLNAALGSGKQQGIKMGISQPHKHKKLLYDSIAGTEETPVG
jgi:hypothetical protein